MGAQKVLQDIKQLEGWVNLWQSAFNKHKNLQEIIELAGMEEDARLVCGLVEPGRRCYRAGGPLPETGRNGLAAFALVLLAAGLLRLPRRI